jgi:cytidine deaminase
MMEQAVAVRKKSICTLFKIPSRRSSPVRQWTNCSNQENAAYPSGLCAERVAIFQAGAIYPEAKILKWLSAASDSINSPYSSMRFLQTINS